MATLKRTELGAGLATPKQIAENRTGIKQANGSTKIGKAGATNENRQASTERHTDRYTAEAPPKTYDTELQTGDWDRPELVPRSSLNRNRSSLGQRNNEERMLLDWGSIRKSKVETKKS